jgi:hypothetical protein
LETVTLLISVIVRTLAFSAAQTGHELSFPVATGPDPVGQNREIPCLQDFPFLF